jgi:hypothetical protein
MTAKRQIESSINSGTMLDGTGGHVISLTTLTEGGSDFRQGTLVAISRPR